MEKAMRYLLLAVILMCTPMLQMSLADPNAMPFSGISDANIVRISENVVMRLAPFVDVDEVHVSKFLRHTIDLISIFFQIGGLIFGAMALWEKNRWENSGRNDFERDQATAALEQAREARKAKKIEKKAAQRALKEALKLESKEKKSATAADLIPAKNKSDYPESEAYKKTLLLMSGDSAVDEMVKKIEEKIHTLLLNPDLSHEIEYKRTVLQAKNEYMPKVYIAYCQTSKELRHKKLGDGNSVHDLTLNQLTTVYSGLCDVENSLLEKNHKNLRISGNFLTKVFKKSGT